MNSENVHQEGGDFDRWHLYGIEGCIHEHDDEDQVRWNQEDGAACDCDEGNAAVDAEFPDAPVEAS